MDALIIEAGVVVNKIIASSVSAAQAAFPSATVVDQTTSGGADIGWLYSGGVFSAPPPVSTENWHVSVYAFRQRFTETEQQAIYNARSSNPLVQIFIDDTLALTGAGVNLADPTTINSVNYLASQALITTTRATQILTTPPAANEVP